VQTVSSIRKEVGHAEVSDAIGFGVAGVSGRTAADGDGELWLQVQVTARAAVPPD
jgi:hypothetical protein